MNFRKRIEVIADNEEEMYVFVVMFNLRNRVTFAFTESKLAEDSWISMTLSLQVEGLGRHMTVCTSSELKSDSQKYIKFRHYI